MPWLGPGMSRSRRVRSGGSPTRGALDQKGEIDGTGIGIMCDVKPLPIDRNQRRKGQAGTQVREAQWSGDWGQRRVVGSAGAIRALTRSWGQGWQVRLGLVEAAVSRALGSVAFDPNIVPATGLGR